MTRTIKSKALLVLAVAVLVALVGWRGYDHVEHDPDFCGTCHSTTVDSWQADEGVVCQSCHTLDMGDRATLASRWLVRQHREVPAHTELARGSCEACHRPDDPRWDDIDGEPGHEVHAGRASLGCLKCHHPEYHGFRPESEDCGRCHTDRHVHPLGMAGVPCLRCHAFNAEGRKSLIPARDDCLDCHGSAPAETPAQVGGGATRALDCALCHDPHRHSEPRLLSCRTCHETVSERPQHASTHHPEDCMSCHRTHHWVAAKAGRSRHRVTRVEGLRGGRMACRLL